MDVSEKNGEIIKCARVRALVVPSGRAVDPQARGGAMRDWVWAGWCALNIVTLPGRGGSHQVPSQRRESVMKMSTLKNNRGTTVLGFRP